MWTPAVAVVWETWRLTRRRLLLVPTLSALCGWLLLRSGAAPLAFVVLFGVALAMAVSMPMIATGPGFPLSKAFARPIRTSVLVAAPLAYVCLASAVCYLAPAAVLRALTRVAFPLVPVAAVIGALAVLVAGSSWVARSPSVRAALAFAAFTVAGLMLRFLDPFRNAGDFFADKVVGPRLFVLSGADYLALMLFLAGVYVWILRGVESQRHRDNGPSLSRPGSDQTPRNSGDILAWVQNACIESFRWRCPVSSPTAAEIWFELQYYGIPVLVIGASLALFIPALMYWGNTLPSAIPVVVAACTLAAPFMAGVSASIWNRRNSWRTQVSAFEAARPIGTGKLIGLQILVTSLCIAGAWLLMATSFWLSLSLLTNLHDFGSPAARAMVAIQKYGTRLLSDVIVAFILLTTALAFLAAIRALVGAYAWRFWLGAVGLVLYLVGMTIAVARGWVGGAVIGVHLWAVAVAIPVGTFLALRRALAAGALSRQQVAGASLVWLPFAALYLDMLRAGGVMEASPALRALEFASTLLPLAAVGFAPWSLSRIRHA